MTLKVKEPLWKQHSGLLKDIVFIIGIAITAGGWFTSEAVSKSKMETKLEIIAKVIDNNNTQLEKINDILRDQQQLNGKIIQYMEMDNAAARFTHEMDKRKK